MPLIAPLLVTTLISQAPDLQRLSIENRKVISWGSETKGANNTENEAWRRYTAFPAPVEACNGDVVTLYVRQKGHNDPDGTINSNTSHDGGRTWLNVVDEPEIFFAPPGQTVTGPTLKLLRSCRLFATFTVTGYTTMPERRAFFSYNDDNGNPYAWSVPQELPRIGSQHTTTGGPCVEKSPDDLLFPSHLFCPVYWRELGEGRYTASMVSSPDEDGSSWSVTGTLAHDSNPNGLQYEEPYVVVLNDGSWLAYVRTDNPRQIWQTRSTGNQEWSELEAAFPGWGYTPGLQLENGALLNITRRAAATWAESYGELRVSWDSGLTYSDPQPIADPAYELGPYVYAGMFPITPNTAAVVHSNEWLAAPFARARTEYAEVHVELEHPDDVAPNIMQWNIVDRLVTELPAPTGAANVLTWPAEIGVPLIDFGGFPFRLKYGCLPGGMVGLPCVQKNGNSRMILQAPTAIAQPFTVILTTVAAYAGTGDLALWDDGGTPTGPRLRRAGNGQLYIRAGGTIAYTSPVSAPTGPMILTAYFDGTSSQVRLNGTNILLPGANPGGVGLANFRLNGNDGWAYDVREILIVRGPTNPQLLELERQVGARNGVDW